MGTSIKLLRRYVWLAETVRRADRITIDEINRQWSRNSLLNDNRETEIPERTFHRHREAIAEIFGIDIVCDRSSNQYYIENPEALDGNSFSANLFSHLAIDNRLLDNPALSARVIDEKVATGGAFLPLVIDALQQQLAVELVYRSQYSGKAGHYTVEPQFLKKSRQRWYMVSKLASGNIIAFALDRFISAQLTDRHYEFDEAISPADYYSDVIGVNLDSDYERERILVKVYAPQRNYLEQLPLHQTQRAIETADDYTVYEYHLRAEYEFQHELMSMGESIEVLEPRWLRHQIKTFAEKTAAANQV